MVEPTCRDSDLNNLESGLGAGGSFSSLLTPSDFKVHPKLRPTVLDEI